LSNASWWENFLCHIPYYGPTEAQGGVGGGGWWWGNILIGALPLQERLKVIGEEVAAPVRKNGKVLRKERFRVICITK